MSGRRILAMILAAGESRRMGRPKQLLPYRDGAIVEAVIGSVLESSIDGLVVVVNPATEAFLGGRLPERCRLALNSQPDSEMLASVKIGLGCIQDAFSPAPDDGVMVLLGDQPEITGGAITTCAEAFRLPYRPPEILIATYRGERGHPAIFSIRTLAEIARWPEGRRLNELAELHPDAVRELPITTCRMPIDVNTPDDYERLRSKA